MPGQAPDNESLPAAAAAIDAAAHVVAFTGAGVSAASGIPTFRDALTGLWAKYDPMELATPEAFARQPDVVTRWYDQRRLEVLERQPNDAHLALTELERQSRPRGQRFTLVTQNVDGLHRRAGSTDPIEIHGSITRWRNTNTGETREMLQPTPLDPYPPRDEDGSPLRPAVVWFGEMLPEGAWERAVDAAASCDVMIAAGTSAAVYPAAGLIDVAREAGATLIECNPEPSLPGEAIRLIDGAEVSLPKLVAASSQPDA